MNSLEHKLIIIGASTGGPGQIQKILSCLDRDFGGTIIIAQHMGEEYLPSFAKALDEKCSMVVSLVEDGESILKNRVYICSGLCRFVFNNAVLKIQRSGSLKNSFNPDIDQLLSSAATLKDNFSLMSVILTGIGNDGSKGCSKLLDAGVRCLGESEKSAVVFGMPKNAKDRNDKVELKSLEEIIHEIIKFGK